NQERIELLRELWPASEQHTRPPDLAAGEPDDRRAWARSGERVHRPDAGCEGWASSAPGTNAGTGPGAGTDRRCKETVRDVSVGGLTGSKHACHRAGDPAGECGTSGAFSQLSPQAPRPAVEVLRHGQFELRAKARPELTRNGGQCSRIRSRPGEGQRKRGAALAPAPAAHATQKAESPDAKRVRKPGERRGRRRAAQREAHPAKPLETERPAESGHRRGPGRTCPSTSRGAAPHTASRRDDGSCTTGRRARLAGAETAGVRLDRRRSSTQ